MFGCSNAISSTVIVVIATKTVVLAYFLSLQGLQLHLFCHLLSLFLHHLLERQESILPELYPLVRVPHTGILNESAKHHEEANKEVNVDGLHVGYLGKGGID